MTPSCSRLFTGEILKTPRKKRKHNEMLSDLVIQSTGSDPSDSLVSPERPGRGTEDISKYPTFPRPNTSGHNEIFAILKQECEYLVQLTVRFDVLLPPSLRKYLIDICPYHDIGPSTDVANSHPGQVWLPSVSHPRYWLNYRQTRLVGRIYLTCQTVKINVFD